MGTTATDRGDHWELNGQKMWISNAHLGDYGLVYAMTDKSAKYKGMTCFIVNLKGNEGIITAPIETKLGLHCAPTGEISFSQAKIPKDSVLGEVGQGFQICMFQLNNTRISCAAGALGIGGGAIEAAIGYANERTQFGKKIGSYQMIQLPSPRWWRSMRRPSSLSTRQHGSRTRDCPTSTRPPWPSFSPQKRQCMRLPRP